MANEQNLKPCKPGETHNPSGRPKGRKSIKTIIDKYFNQELSRKNPLSKEVECLTVQEHIMLKAMAKAMMGDGRAREDLLNRRYGKPTETIKQHNTGELDIDIKDIDAKIEELLKIREKANNAE